MPGARLDRAGDAQQVRERGVAHRHDVGDLGPADGQRPGLVEGDGLDLVDGLQVGAALEHRAVTGGVRHRRDHRRGHGESKPAGAGDHEDDEPAQDEGVPVGAEEERRHDGDQHAEDEHRRRVVLGEVVGEGLVGGLAGLGLLDRHDDLGEHRLGSRLVDPHLERAVLVHGPGEDALAALLVDRHGLAGDGRLVDVGRALGDRPVDRDALPRPDDDDVADADVLGRQDDLAAVHAHERLLGHERDERADGPARLVHRVGLEHVAERVDEDEDGRLLPHPQDHGAHGADEHEQVDGRRQVEQGEDRLARRVVDADEDREHVDRVVDPRRCAQQVVERDGHEDEDAGAVERELLTLAPPGAALLPVSDQRRAQARCRDRPHHVLFGRLTHVVGDPGASGHRIDGAAGHAAQAAQLAFQDFRLAGAVHALNVKVDRLGAFRYFAAHRRPCLPRMTSPPCDCRLSRAG